MQAAHAPQTRHRPQVVADTSFSASDALTREGAPLAGKGAAARSVPDGNHGDNLQTTKRPLFKPNYVQGWVSGFLTGFGSLLSGLGFSRYFDTESYHSLLTQCLAALK